MAELVSYVSLCVSACIDNHNADIGKLFCGVTIHREAMHCVYKSYRFLWVLGHKIYRYTIRTLEYVDPKSQ